MSWRLSPTAKQAAEPEPFLTARLLRRAAERLLRVNAAPLAERRHSEVLVVVELLAIDIVGEAPHAHGPLPLLRHGALHRGGALQLRMLLLLGAGRHGQLAGHGALDVGVLAAVLVVLAAGLVEAGLGLGAAGLQHAQLVVEALDLLLLAAHVQVVLAHLLVQRLQHALEHARALEPLDRPRARHGAVRVRRRRAARDRGRGGCGALPRPGRGGRRGFCGRCCCQGHAAPLVLAGDLGAGVLVGEQLLLGPAARVGRGAGAVGEQVCHGRPALGGCCALLLLLLLLLQLLLQ